MAVDVSTPASDSARRAPSPPLSSVSASPLSLSPLSLPKQPSRRRPALRQVRRVSFSDPDSPPKKLCPGAASAWDGPICWILFFVAFAVRFYRLALPGSVGMLSRFMLQAAGL